MRRAALCFALLSLAGCGLDKTGLGDSTNLQNDGSITVDDTGVVDDGGIVIVDSTPKDTSVEPDAALDTFVPPDTFVAPDTGPEVVDTGPPCTGTVFGGHCYFLIAMADSFDASNTACTSAGAHLVSITSTEEEATVEAIGMGERWIGLTKDMTSPYDKASFHWTTGESGTAIDNWDIGEPNGTGPCARLHANGKWADWTCDAALPAICERE